MKNLTTTAIILGHKNFGESDKIIYIYTEEFGKLNTIAKGARKINSKFTGHIETLNFSKISIYFGPKNIILTEILTLKSFKRIRENLEKITNALKIAQFTNKLIYENQKIPELENLMANSLNHLSTSQKPHLILHSYIIKLLDKTGLIPDFKSIKSTLELKYLKYLHFIKTQPLHSIENISLNEKETQEIEKLITKFMP